MKSALENVASQKRLQPIATETLTTFANIAEQAVQRLKAETSPRGNSFASINTLTNGQAVKNLDRIGEANIFSYQHLRSEPAIARVVVADESGAKHTYYICKVAPLSDYPNLASYRAPIGRLASLEVGAEFTLPNGVVLEVVEQARLNPCFVDGAWDAHNTVVEGEDFGPLTVESLRKLLGGVTKEPVDEDILGQILSEQNAKANIYDGVRRSIITKMGLRDQAVLDKYQDEIFRLPLDKRLLLLGPPGTGKTTTLIRRLGQKRDTEFLDESEQRLVQRLAEAQEIPHASNWLMFTPTELLKQYLREAFNREGVPAPEQQLKTWQDYRRELARNTFGILRTSTGGGTFVQKDNLPSLDANARTHSVQWFEDFDIWQRKAFLDELKSAAQELAKAPLDKARDLSKRLLSILDRSTRSDATVFEALAREHAVVQELVTKLKEETDLKVRAALNLQLNRDRTFLSEMADFITELQKSSAQTDEDDEQDDDEDDEPAAATTTLTKAQAIYNRAVKAQARAAAGKRSSGKTSRNGRVLEWIANRSLAEEERAAVGQSLLTLTAARRFLNPVRRYVGATAKRYRSFRRERQKAGRWYQSGGFEVRDIHPLEVDLVLLAILRGAGELIGRPTVQRQIDTPIWAALKPIVGLYRNQILVDEATDFSPIQLACMAGLTHPRLRSFFACGDFNQRLTTWGSQSRDEMRWVFEDVDIKEVNVSYRQTRQLNDLAHAIIQTVGATEHGSILPAHVNAEGVDPVLREHVTGDEVAIWMAERIREIDRFYEQLPAIAIFVNTEDQVSSMADALSDSLVDDNIQVVACREGQSVGRESDVRVFSIQHIKGLEFEAVFFVGVDQLAQQHPDLFDKYLYVGTTRAAAYLGLTCETSLPPVIETLRPHFGQHWRLDD